MTGQDRAGGEPLDRTEPAAGATLPVFERADDYRLATSFGPGWAPDDSGRCSTRRRQPEDRLARGEPGTGRSVTRPVAAVGFDDFELADMLPIPVTVIAHTAADLGRAAAELLFSRLAGDTRPPQRIVIPVRLVERGTGEIPGPAGATPA